MIPRSVEGYNMRFNRRILTLAAAAVLACAPAWAQTAPAPAPPPAPAPAPPPAAASQADVPPDPVVGRVNAEEIHLSDIAAAAQGLPDQYRNMPSNTLYPLLL